MTVPWDVDKELSLSPRREDESVDEHWQRLHDEAVEENKLFKEWEQEKLR